MCNQNFLSKILNIIKSSSKLFILMPFLAVIIVPCNGYSMQIFYKEVSVLPGPPTID